MTAICPRAPRRPLHLSVTSFGDWATTGTPTMPRAAARSNNADRTSPGRRDDAVRSAMDALRRIVRELRLTSRDAEHEAGISGAQLFVLQALAEESATSLNDLAQRTLTDQSSVSVVVKRLVDRNLVVRRPSGVDARRVELALSPAGRRLVARCPEPTQARLLTALRKLGTRDFDALRAGLSALVREMGLDEKAARMFFDEEPTTRRARKG
jgi:DNA-binding MarR family transcriptional regulator